MSDTYSVDLNNTEWTDISQDNIVGYISNISITDIFLLQRDTQPDSSEEEGHPLESCDGINFALVDNETIWARSHRAEGKVLVTPGI